jgi:hypothetical protein
MKPIGHRLARCMIRHQESDTLRRAPVTLIASMCDVDRRFLYEIMNGERPMPDSLCSRLDAVLTAHEAGELVFRRAGWTWEAEWITPPNPLPPPQERMTRSADWNQWARCRSCGGGQWTRVTLHGAPAHWYLCDTCMWWETAGVGAQRTKESKARRVKT